MKKYYMPLQNTQPTTIISAPSTKKRIPKWLKIIGIVVAVFVVFILVVTIITVAATSAAQKVSDEFVNDLQASNTSAAYGLTAKRFQASTTEIQLDDVVQQIAPTLQGEETVTGRAIESSSGSAQTAVLVYTIKTPASSTAYIKVELQKDDDNWRVINFRSSETPLDTEVE
ncbi:MAG: hypothetical protein WAT17_04400 [Candidatus Saccharimonadales bacterium]|jgi:hypothetical protein